MEGEPPRPVGLPARWAETNFPRVSNLPTLQTNKAEIPPCITLIYFWLWWKCLRINGCTGEGGLLRREGSWQATSATFNFLEQVRRCGVTCILCIVSLLSERQCTVTRTNRDPQALKKGPGFLWNRQALQWSPKFGTWSQMGPKSKFGPKKVPILHASPKKWYKRPKMVPKKCQTPKKWYKHPKMVPKKCQFCN